MTKDKYKLNFTAGALLINESFTVLDEYMKTKDWGKTQSNILEKNLLQARMASSAKRTIQEVIPRLKTLTDSQIDYYKIAPHNDKICLLWLAICKNYKFIADFAIEVVREKFLNMNYVLDSNDFDIFYYNKEEWHPELENIKDLTKYKLRQVLYLMLKEAGIVDSNNIILSPILSNEIIDVIKNDSASTLAIFPVAESLL